MPKNYCRLWISQFSKTHIRIRIAFTLAGGAEYIEANYIMSFFFILDNSS